MELHNPSSSFLPPLQNSSPEQDLPFFPKLFNAKPWVHFSTKMSKMSVFHFSICLRPSLPLPSHFIFPLTGTTERTPTTFTSSSWTSARFFFLRSTTWGCCDFLSKFYLPKQMVLSLPTGNPQPDWARQDVLNRLLLCFPKQIPLSSTHESRREIIWALGISQTSPVR